MKNLMNTKVGAGNTAKPGLKTALCEALFSYVLTKTGIFPKSDGNRCLFWANY